MTPDEHYARAEVLVKSCADLIVDQQKFLSAGSKHVADAIALVAATVAMAQVHATLATAAR